MTEPNYTSVTLRFSWLAGVDEGRLQELDEIYMTIRGSAGARLMKLAERLVLLWPVEKLRSNREGW